MAFALVARLRVGRGGRVPACCIGAGREDAREAETAGGARSALRAAAKKAAHLADARADRARRPEVKGRPLDRRDLAGGDLHAVDLSLF